MYYSLEQHKQTDAMFGFNPENYALVFLFNQEGPIQIPNLFFMGSPGQHNSTDFNSTQDTRYYQDEKHVVKNSSNLMFWTPI